MTTLLRVQVTAVEGYAAKAKVQASVRYVDQESGKDLDPGNKQGHT